jgi:hypothetical protein
MTEPDRIRRVLQGDGGVWLMNAWQCRKRLQRFRDFFEIAKFNRDPAGERASGYLQSFS